MPCSSRPSDESTPQRCSSRVGSGSDWAALTRLRSDECFWPPVLLMGHDVHPVDIQFDGGRRRIALPAGIIDARRQAGEIGDSRERGPIHTPGSPNVTADLDAQIHCSRPAQCMTWCTKTRAKRSVRIATKMPDSTRGVLMNSRSILRHELSLPSTAPRLWHEYDPGWGRYPAGFKSAIDKPDSSSNPVRLIKAIAWLIFERECPGAS